MGFNGGGSGGGVTSPLTTLADTFVGGPSGAAAREPVGTSNQVIAADSSNTATGLTYQYAQGKNYLLNPNFESATTTGWTLGTVTLTGGIPTGTPSFGSGASGTASLSIVSVLANVLGGANSLFMQDTSNFVAGNFIASSVFTIDNEDIAKVMSVTHSYRGGGNTTAPGTAAGTFGIALWDVTNNAFINTTTTPWATYNSIGFSKAAVNFQLSATGTAYRLVFYIATATSGAGAVTLDDFILGPAPQNTSAPSITAAANTLSSATVTANTAIGFTTITNDSMAGFSGSGSTFKYTVPVAGVYTVSLVMQTGTSASGQSYVAKNGTFTGTPANYLGTSNATLSAAGTNTASYNAGDTIQIASNASITATTQWSLSIVCNSNNTVAPANPNVVTNLNTLSSTAVTSGTALRFTTIETDSTASYNTATGVYTCSASGWYLVTAIVDACTVVYGLQLFRNGAAITGASLSSTFLLSSTGTVGTGSRIGYYNADDTLTVVPNATSVQSTTTRNSIGIALLANPAAASTSNLSVGARYYASATAISGTLATVVFSTKDYDDTNSYSNSTGTYTIPYSGKWAITSGILVSGTFALNSTLIIAIFKNGVETTRSSENAAGAVTSAQDDVSDTLRCLANDLITIRVSSSATTPAISASTTAVYFNICREGN